MKTEEKKNVSAPEDYVEKAIAFYKPGVAVTYNVSKEVQKVVEDACSSINANFCHTDLLSDLLAMPCFVYVCDFSKTPPDELKQHYACILEMEEEPNLMPYLLVAEPSVQPPKEVEKYFIPVPEILDAQSLRLLFLKYKALRKRRVGQIRSYDSKLFRLFYILNYLRTNKTLKAKELCLELNVSERTITRDINMLMSMGEGIEYNSSKKWYEHKYSIIG